MRKILTTLVCLLPCLAGAWSKVGTVYTTDGSFNDVKSAVYLASNGDTVNVPAGNFVWGHTNEQIYITAAITLQGAGTNSTFITLPDDSGAYFNNAVVVIMAAATVKGFTMAESVNSAATGFAGTTVNGWRVSDINYTSGGGAYFMYAGSYGRIDHCTITGGNGSTELIFLRGPTDAWQTPDNLGTTNCVLVEDCVFNGAGYVCDANSNGRITVRFCTINGAGIKIDAHGKASNYPARGVRLTEAYENRWTSVGVGGSWPAMEIRGGTGMLFNNIVDDDTSSIRGMIQLTEYGAQAAWPNFGSVFQTPYNYPVDDQVGVGQDPKAAGSAPLYLWNNLKAGSPLMPNWAQVASGAVDLFRTQTGNPSTNFVMSDIIKSDRDYFIQTTGDFDGSSGVGAGTKAQMLAITPTKTNVAFWVTDEGNWNMTALTNHSGQLYAWNGSAWVLKYVPLTYPLGQTTNSYVPPPQLPPLAVADAWEMVKNSAATIKVTKNDKLRTTNGVLSIVSVAATNGTASVVNATNIYFTPTVNFYGIATVGYTITDGIMATNSSALLTVSVTNTAYYGGAQGNSNAFMVLKFDGALADSSVYATNFYYAAGGWSVIYTNDRSGHAGKAALVQSNYDVTFFSGPYQWQDPGTYPADVWSFAAWFKPYTDGTIVTMEGEFNSTFTDRGLMFTNGMVSALYNGLGGAGTMAYLQATNKLALGQWHHVALVCNYGLLTLYEEGLAVTNVDLGKPAVVAWNTSTWGVSGRNPWAAGNFTAVWDDVYIWNTYALSADEVAALAGLVVPPAQHSLTVVGGSGSGSYTNGRVVTITANTVSGQAFTNWTGYAVANAYAPSTTLTMPATNVTVTANFYAVTNAPTPGLTNRYYLLLKP